jgi:ABC-type phosphate transport system auxiliary subunit
MTQANDQPNDRERLVDRQLRILDRRLTRLEETQLTGKEINSGFDRVYDEIDALEEQINARFDRLEGEVKELRTETNGKLDLILRRLTGMGQGNEGTV